MGKLMKTVLVFVLVLAALLALEALVQRFLPEREAEETVEAAPTPAPEEPVIVNEMTPNSATSIEFREDGVSLTGIGAETSDGVVTIRYPGTYRLSGSRTDGQLVVDLGDGHGGVYLLLDGLSLGCMDGPAVHVEQADLTVLYLEEGTQNALWDGDGYVIQEKSGTDKGAAVYSEDDLVLEGDGALALSGYAADGIRSKDGLTVNGGEISVWSIDDGRQGSDYVKLSGGVITITSTGDGVTTRKGDITVDGAVLTVTADGDGLQSAADILVSAGSVTAATHGGADHYTEIGLSGVSAKGLKGMDITLTGGTVKLDTADDGLHAEGDLTISGAVCTVASGDDAFHAGGTLAAEDTSLYVTRSYEALEADTLRLTNAGVNAAAENNGLSGGPGGVRLENVQVNLAAPRGVSTEGVLSLAGGCLTLYADGTDSLFAYGSLDLGEGALLALAETGRAETLLEKAAPAGGLLFVFNDPVPAGTEMTLGDASGEPVFTAVRTDADTGALLLAGGDLEAGQSYTLTAGEREPVSLTAGEEWAVFEEPLPTPQPAGGFGGFPGGFGGPPGPWR